MVAKIRDLAATDFALATTPGIEAPACASLAASTATNPSAIDAFVESTISMGRSISSAALLADWCVAETADATVTQTIPSSAGTSRNASTKSPGDGAEVDAISSSA